MKEEKEDGMGFEWAVLVGGLLLALCFLLNTCAGEGRPEGLRGTLSANWHHIGCMFSLCDEDGLCPVWSSKYSKCYMLDGAGVKELNAYVKFGCTRKEYEKRELCF